MGHGRRDGQGLLVSLPIGRRPQLRRNPETRYILQKGDNFHDPDRAGKQLRYVAEFMKGVGTSQPKCEFIRENLK